MAEPSPFDDHGDVVDPVGDHVDALIDFGEEHAEKLLEIEQVISGTVLAQPVSSTAPLGVHVTAREHVHVTDLFPEDAPDPLTRKILLALQGVGEELWHLSQRGEREVVPGLLLFGWSGRSDDGESWRPGASEAMFGRSLGFFQHAYNWHQRACAALVNALQQLSALYRADSPVFPAWQSVRPRSVLDAMCALGKTLAAADAAVASNAAFQPAWDKYASLVRRARTDPAQLGRDAGDENGMRQVMELEAMLVAMGDVVAKRRFVEAVLTENFDAPFEEGAPQVEVAGNRVLVKVLAGAAGETAAEAVKRLGTHSEGDEGSNFVGACFLCALARAIEPPGVRPDTKPIIALWKALEYFPVVPLLGRATFRGDEFLRTHCAVRELDFDKLKPDPTEAREKAAQKSAESLPAKAALVRDRVSAWLLRAQQAFHPSPVAGDPLPSPSGVVGARLKILAQAVALCEQAGAVAREFLALQTAAGAPVGLRAVDALARIVESLKATEGCLAANASEIAVTVPLATREVCARAREALRPLRMQMEVTLERSTDPGLSVLTVATAAEALDALLLGTEGWSKARRSAAKMLLAVVSQPAGKLAAGKRQELEAALYDLDVLGGVQDRVARAADCSFLYFSRDLLQALLPRLAQSESQSRRIPFLLAAFSDAFRLLLTTEHLPMPTGKEDEHAGTPEENLFRAYERFLRAAVETAMVHPLCRAVEADLRVHVHAVLLAHVGPPNPKRPEARVPAHLLELPPLRLGSQLYSLRGAVTAWLEGVLYSGTTVALHDWRTYGEMAALAADKYGLQLADPHLPMGTLDTGLDVLRIMRRLKVFVARFAYSMHEEVFVERQTEKGSKHLHVVSARSVAGSVRQHGAGMLNTTVNVAYRFLKDRFRTLNQFLYDDYIRSHLAAERKWFKRNRKQCDNKYPLERAQALHKDIRRLGTTAAGISYLDKFRMLITQMGNALGFVRMVRSAGMRSAASAVRFVPDLDALQAFRFADHTRAEGMVLGKSAASKGRGDDSDEDEEDEDEEDEEDEEPNADGTEKPSKSSTAPDMAQETVQAAEMLDEVVHTLLDHFSEDVDYFRMLVDIFQKGLVSQMGETSTGEDGKKKRKRESHLRAFFACIPALTLSYIAASRAAKENLDKAHKGRVAFFADDGFALGVAYLLAVLQQDNAFESLHWFESVRDSLAQQAEEAKAERARMGRAGDEGAAALEFRQRRLAAQAREFQMLSFSIYGARIFFRQEDEHETRATKMYHDGATAAKAVRGRDNDNKKEEEEEKAPAEE